MRKIKEFKVPILNTEYKVYVFIGDREKANKGICKYLEQKGEFIEEHNRGKVIYSRGWHPCIWIDDRLKGKELTATLAHEAIHAVSHIMDYLGMDMQDKTGNEFLAHSVAAVIRICL